MLFPGYLPTFPASILEPVLNMHTASSMSVITNMELYVPHTKGYTSNPRHKCPKRSLII